MVLTLRALAARRPHVLVVAPAGSARVRAAVEAVVDARRWVHATSPADTDVLVEAGAPGPRLAAVVDAVWATVPAPRVRVRVTSAGEAAEVLDGAAAALARGGPDPQPAPALPSPAMADLADGDRDGLALDALHVPLGPVLPAWPDGLVVHAVLAGDVVTAARAEVLDHPTDDPADHPTDDPLDPRAARLDALARVLALAGADGPARRARALRDDPAPTAAAAADLGRRLRRDRVLAWTLRDAPLRGGADGPGDGPDDVAAWVRCRAAELVGGQEDAVPPPRPSPDEAAAALVGLELGAARLALAALDPEPAASPVRETP